MSTQCTSGSNLSVKDSTETIDPHGVLNTYLLSPSMSLLLLPRPRTHTLVR